MKFLNSNNVEIQIRHHIIYDIFCKQSLEMCQVLGPFTSKCCVACCGPEVVTSAVREHKKGSIAMGESVGERLCVD